MDYADVLDSDLFIPVMYTDSDMSFVIANAIINKCTQYRLEVGICIHFTG